MTNQTDKPKTMREYMPENLVELKYQFLFKETEPIQVHEGIFEGMKIGTARVFIQKEELNKLIQSQLQSVFEEIGILTQKYHYYPDGISEGNVETLVSEFNSLRQKYLGSKEESK